MELQNFMRGSQDHKPDDLQEHSVTSRASKGPEPHKTKAESTHVDGSKEKAPLVTRDVKNAHLVLKNKRKRLRVFLHVV